MDFTDRESVASDKVLKYMRLMCNPSKIAYALKRLEKIDMNVELLSETGIGIIMNRLRTHAEHGSKANDLVEKWTKVAVESGLKRKSSGETSVSAVSKLAPKRKLVEVDMFEGESSSKASKVEHKKHRTTENNVEPTVGRVTKQVSFSEMLARGDVKQHRTIRKAITKPKSIDWINTDLDINYQPAMQPSPPSSLFQDTPNPAILDASVFKPRKDVRKVYAGRSKLNVCREVSSLVNICTKVLTHNIDAIEEVGDAPYYLLKPVLERCTPEQLSAIERKNPVKFYGGEQIADETDELWMKHVNASFHRDDLAEDKTWRDCYMRLKHETNAKLKSVTQRITQHNREVKAPVRTAILADAKAPRDVRKLQMRYGTGHVTHELPDAADISRARKAIFNEGSQSGAFSLIYEYCKDEQRSRRETVELFSGTKQALKQLPAVVQNSRSTLGSSSACNSAKREPLKKKKGILMVKVRRLMKSVRR